VSSRGFLIRFLLGLAGSIAALSLGAGAFSSSRPEAQVLGAGVESGSWATSAELAWLKRLGAWNTQLLVGLQTAAVSPARQAAGTCTDLTTKVGPPPTRRLGRAFVSFRRACAHLRSDQTHAAVNTLVQADQLVPPGEHRELPVAAGVSRESRIEPRFGRIASALAGKHVEVRCWSSADWLLLMREESVYTQGQLGSETLGFAGIGGARVNLAPAVCDGLVDLTDRQLQPRDDVGQLRLASALVTLAHEPQHSKGIGQEGVAECNAIQLAPQAAEDLHLNRAYATSLLRTYWRHYGDELPQYRSSECHEGGALDLGRAESIWP
jgi:hypothetical protein